MEKDIHEQAAEAAAEWEKQRVRAASFGPPRNDEELEIQRKTLSTLLAEMNQRIDRYVLTANAGGLVISLQIAISEYAGTISFLQLVLLTAVVLIFAAGVFSSGAALMASTVGLSFKTETVLKADDAMNAWVSASMTDLLLNCINWEKRLRRGAITACCSGILLGVAGVVISLWFPAC